MENFSSQVYKHHFEKYKFEADLGYPKAQLQVGSCYLEGKGVQQSYEEAFKYFKLAADQSDLDAQYMLGHAYKEGKGVQNSDELSFKYFRLAANQNHPKAQYQVGLCFEKGRGVEQSYEQAFHYFKLVADQGIATSQYALGNAYRKGKGVQQSHEKAFEYYRKAADQGLALGQNALALYFEKGIGGFEKSHSEAIKYFRLAADQGLAVAQYYLGNYYFEGKILEKSFERAIDYYRLAANGGERKAQYALGKCYELGYGVEKSLEQAEKFYQLAAHQAQKKERFSLSNLKHVRQLRNFVKNIDLPKQLKLSKNIDAEALKYHQLAADSGDKEAQFMLGELYRTGGRDFKEDWEKALIHYKLAASQGHVGAIKFLYKSYHYGYKVKESQNEALKYLKIGVEQNDPECQYNLGVYYFDGKGGLSQSIIEAFKYWKLAASQGHLKAALSLAPRVLHPSAKEVDIEEYLQDHQISTLERILKSYTDHPAFLEKPKFSWEEALAIRDAMIANPRLALLYSEQEISRLFLAFELAGYDTKKDLQHAWLVSPSTHQAILGCVFVGDDLRNSLLKSNNQDPDPEVIERKRLQSIAESKIKENCHRAYQLHSQLPKNEILYPHAEKIDIGQYLKDGKIDSLIKILEDKKDKPIYLSIPKASHEELLVIRDAMIENPMFTFLCLNPDNYSLEEAFYQAEYHSPCLKKKKIKIDGQLFQGLLFKGERSK